MALLLVFLSVISTSTALECYTSHSTVEKCSDSFFFAPFCFNRTETLEDGKTRHTFGCADWKMKAIPGKSGHSYCFNPDGNPFMGKGKLCLCESEKCNRHPYHYRKPLHIKNYAVFNQSSSTTYLSAFILLLTIVAFN